ncbi:DUF3618 domain-containing protein [Methylocaldum szegediense]|uniref:DUF3618 domain-containing protein n=1 Tax=Methylocaldum szegediense TaxID=73780 RepID=A0ABM9I7Z9_9GAMM|nr:DUF3618 domain-containing protein [Methylocaldum szegediense]CAI8949759.1 conserved protein of unknown function [Methylocaldum szegediense]
MATYDETRSPEQIETDIERTRSQIAKTLDTIQKRFSPGQLLDQALGYLDEMHIGENFRRLSTNAGTVIKENPIPVSLLGIGFTWLALSGRAGTKGHLHLPRFTKPSHGMEGLHSLHGEVPRSEPYAAGGGQGEGAIGERMEHVKGRVSDTVGHVRETLGDKASHVRHSVSDTMSSVREKAGDISHRAQDQAAQLGHAVQERYQHVAQDQPLLLGVLGLAIGAALGAFMPRTRMEDEMMGETRDRLAREARETGRDIMREAPTEGERLTREPMSGGPTEAESSPLTAGSMAGEIRRDMARGETGTETSPVMPAAGGPAGRAPVVGTTAGGTTNEGLGGVTRTVGGEEAAGAESMKAMPPMGERRSGVRDRRKGSLAETVGAATRFPPAEERRHGLPDRRISGSASGQTGYDSPNTP